MITIESKGNQIFIFGRDDNNNVYCNQEKFLPYFYVEDKNGEYISIDGKKLKIIKCINPYDIYKLREQYSKHYEADVVFVNRFIIDNFKEIKQENVRKCFIDLETRKPETGYDDPFKASGEILCIGCYDNFNKEHKQFTLIDYENEKEMVKAFINYIRETDPDMMIAWNGDGFDFPYLLNRINKIGINVNCLARQNEVYRGSCKYENKYDVSIGGRILFDLLYAYKKWSSGEGRESFSLDYISRYEKLGEKEKYKGTLDELYKQDIEKFKLYNKVDVELMVLLDEKLKLVEFFDSLRRLCFCKFEDVFMNSKLADCLCLKYAKEHNIVLPSSKKHENKEKFEGGFVQNSIPGLHQNVACMDFKSLYPSIMLGFNTSYETLLNEPKGDYINGINKYFFKREPGIIPSIVKPLLERRAVVKKELKNISDRTTREYQTKYMEQYTLKTIANSFYGVLGYKNFRLYKREIAGAITYLSRKTIKEATKWFKEKGYSINYGDTDSIFCSMNDKSINDFKKLTIEVNNYLKDFYRNYRVKDEDNIIELQFEKVYKNIFFKGTEGKGVKKKYAGILIWEDGKDCYKYQRKGFESRRSDSPQIGRTFLDDVLKMIVENKTKEEIMLFIQEFERKLRTEIPPEEIAIPIGISKHLHLYTNQIHARASRLANERHNAGIQSGDKIKYIYVKNRDGVIAFKSEGYLWDEYQVDYDKMIRRIINLKIGPIFDSLGWSHNYTTKLNKKKKRLLLKNILKQNELW